MLMKQSFLCFLLSIYVSFTLAQGNGLDNNIPTRTINMGWDLDQHVWSHTHSFPHKKPLLDFDALDNWTRLSEDKDLSISPDGNYFAYGIQKGVDYSVALLDSVVVQATDNVWRKAFWGVKPGFFSADSKLYVFERLQGLCFLQVGTNSMEYIAEVRSYKLPSVGSKNECFAYQLKNNEVVLQSLVMPKNRHFPEVTLYDFDKSGRWLTCRLKNDLGAFFICNVRSLQVMHFASVSAYKFDALGRLLVLRTLEKNNNGTITALQSVNLVGDQLELVGIAKRIWSTQDTLMHVSDFSIDNDGRQILFVISNGNRFVNGARDATASTPENSIWYWCKGMDAAKMKVNNQTAEIEATVYIRGEASFTDNGSYIFFRLQDRPDPRPVNRNLVQVDVWDYKDKGLKYSKKMQPESNYNSVFNIRSGQVIRILKEHEILKALMGNFALVAKSGKKIYGDRFWEKDYRRDSNWLVNLQNGSRYLLSTSSNSPNIGWFSPDEKYLVFFDPAKQCNYFSYNLGTGELVKISIGVPAWCLGFQGPNYYSGHCAWKQPTRLVDGGLAGWLESDQGVLVYDEFDIWKLDLTGKKPAVNITNGLGRMQGIKFALMETPRDRANEVVLSKQIILKAFNTKNKKSGYYQLSFDTSGGLKLLCMEAAYTQWMEGVLQYDPGMPPLKAADDNAWIVRRQTATEPSNYYITNDFKKFKALTNIQTQKQYNWFIKELHSFKELNGTLNTGLLYKPENFDPYKKYPVVIVFYNLFTDNLNQFSYPAYSEDALSFGINPAWLASHGYLVFTPDIYVEPLKFGPSAFNIVEGAVRYLKQLPFVDGDHIGACAHSWSAKLGSYVFTHSRSVAAMAISEGVAFANPVSLALSAREDVASSLESIEKGFQYGNLWESKASWLDQTAVLNADKASCPLLLFCGGRNAESRINQTFQLFVALRRLEKKTWWLEYPNGAHNVHDIEAKDYTIRFTQYFDHYLKGAPPPVWMTSGLPQNVKGIESRYELDLEGRCGKKCAMCDKLKK